MGMAGGERGTMDSCVYNTLGSVMQNYFLMNANMLGMRKGAKITKRQKKVR